LRLGPKASAFIAWSVERDVSLHAYLYMSRNQTYTCWKCIMASSG